MKSRGNSSILAFFFFVHEIDNDEDGIESMARDCDWQIRFFQELSKYVQLLQDSTIPDKWWSQTDIVLSLEYSSAWRTFLNKVSPVESIRIECLVMSSCKITFKDLPWNNLKHLFSTLNPNLDSCHKVHNEIHNSSLQWSGILPVIWGPLKKPASFKCQQGSNLK